MNIMTMKTFCVFLADGFEEVEALTPVDVLRRSGLLVKTVSISDVPTVTGSHGVTIIADTIFSDLDKKSIEMIILPGGMPGATHLDSNKEVGDLLMEFAHNSKPISAICAAPMVLGKRGLLLNKKATCYPGFEKFLSGAQYTKALVEVDGNIITGKGPGAAMEFAFTIAEKYIGKEKTEELKDTMMIQR